MTSEEGSYYRDRSLDGSQAAAAWALRLLGETGAHAAAGELLDSLPAMEPTTRRVLIVQMVNLVGQTAARPQVKDVATLRQLLTFMVEQRVPDDVADEAIRRVEADRKEDEEDGD